MLTKTRHAYYVIVNGNVAHEYRNAEMAWNVFNTITGEHVTLEYNGVTIAER